MSDLSVSQYCRVWKALCQQQLTCERQIDMWMSRVKSTTSSFHSTLFANRTEPDAECCESAGFINNNNETSIPASCNDEETAEYMCDVWQRACRVVAAVDGLEVRCRRLVVAEDTEDAAMAVQQCRDQLGQVQQYCDTALSQLHRQEAQLQTICDLLVRTCSTSDKLARVANPNSSAHRPSLNNRKSNKIRLSGWSKRHARVSQPGAGYSVSHEKRTEVVKVENTCATNRLCANNCATLDKQADTSHLLPTGGGDASNTTGNNNRFSDGVSVVVTVGSVSNECTSKATIGNSLTADVLTISQSGRPVSADEGEQFVTTVCGEQSAGGGVCTDIHEEECGHEAERGREAATRYYRYLDEFGRTGGWHEEEHATFVALSRLHRREEDGCEAIAECLPGRNAAEIWQHWVWFRRLCQLDTERRKALSAWLRWRQHERECRLEESAPDPPAAHGGVAHGRQQPDREHALRQIREWRARLTRSAGVYRACGRPAASSASQSRDDSQALCQKQQVSQRQSGAVSAHSDRLRLAISPPTAKTPAESRQRSPTPAAILTIRRCDWQRHVRRVRSCVAQQRPLPASRSPPVLAERCSARLLQHTMCSRQRHQQHPSSATERPTVGVQQLPRRRVPEWRRSISSC